MVHTLKSVRLSNDGAKLDNGTTMKADHIHVSCKDNPKRMDTPTWMLETRIKHQVLGAKVRNQAPNAVIQKDHPTPNTHTCVAPLGFCHVAKSPSTAWAWASHNAEHYGNTPQWCSCWTSANQHDGLLRISLPQCRLRQTHRRFRVPFTTKAYLHGIWHFVFSVH